MTQPAQQRPNLHVVASDGSLLPPSDDDAERAVLSAAIVDETSLPKVIDFLRPDHFASEAHRRIFEAVVEMFRAKQPIDMITVMSWLKARDRLAQVGGAGYLCEIIQSEGVIANVRAHAVAVHDAYRRRRTIFACQRIVAQGYTGVGDVQAWCTESTKALGAISMQNPLRPIETNDQALARIVREACEQPNAPSFGGEAVRMTGYPIGIHGIDRILGGLRKKAKTTVAATTGAGKTAFAVQASVAVAKAGVGVLFFSLELERPELLRRALASESGISATRIRDRLLTTADKVTIAQASSRLSALPWRIDESPRLTIEQIAAASKAMQEEMLLVHRVPLGMIVLDYIQRLDPSPTMTRRERHEQVGHATKNFKILCQELDVVGLELAQAKDGKPGQKPTKPTPQANIADSTQIGKESDDVIFLVPDAPMGPRDPRIAVEAVIAKQRAGAKGCVPLMFRGDTYTFIDPNAPGYYANPSRQYVDESPDSNDLTKGL